MRATAAAALTCLAFLAASSGHRFRALKNDPPSVSVHLARLWSWGAVAFQTGRYEEAAAAFSAAARYARRVGRPDFEAQCLNNVGAAWLAALQFRDAVDAYLQARDISERRGDRRTAATISCNLATLYAQMGDGATARAEAERALELARSISYSDPQLLLRAATLRARSGQWSEALPLFDEAARLADQKADAATLAQVWRTAGYEQLRAGRLVAAEPLLLEAFRLHRLRRLPDAYLAYRNVALLRAAQGDLVSAERWMNTALEQARSSPMRVPLWPLYYERGELRRRSNRVEAALGDFRRAADLARRWRLGAVPAEAFAISVETGLHHLYAALAETAATLALDRRDPELIHEALEAAEENRAASLRSRLEDAGQFALPPVYGELLRELHSLELVRADGGARAASARVQEVRRRLVELEVREGLRYGAATSFRWERGASLVARLQRALGDDEAYVAFQLGAAASYRWSATNRGVEVDVLPPRTEILRAVSSFVERIQRGGRYPLEEGRQLYRQLFSGLGASVLARRTWFLGLDADLFFVPFAALPSAAEKDRPVYLVEERAIQILPGANMLSPVRAERWQGAFLAVADPIYNRADARWHGALHEARREYTPWFFPRARAGTLSLELPRLPGSAREVRACALAWGEPPVLLEGARANGHELHVALASGPAVLHLAAHVVATDPRHESVSIALSLGPDGAPELLGPDAIRRLRPAPALVVLNGCRTAVAPALPGAGLLGLTRAWLLAGARAVVATLWQVPDEEGDLFVSFYRHLTRLERHGSRAPALALREAQRDMLSRTDWRADPHYWAGYVVTGVP